MIYQYNKLVRDNIPSSINSIKGRKATWRKLDENEYINELNKKLIEEAHEFIEENSIEELADLMEVVENIMRVKNINWESVKDAQNVKRSKKGSFLNRVYLEYVEEDEKNEEEEKELNKEWRKRLGKKD